jgi:hypothetical protein
MIFKEQLQVLSRTCTGNTVPFCSLGDHLKDSNKASSLGSIVRVGPNEISIDDIEVHNSVLFCQGPKFMKVSDIT